MRVPIPIFIPSLPPLEDPIRSELFGIERLELHAASLAVAQVVATGAAPQRALLPRVDENGRVLREANRLIAEAVLEGKAAAAMAGPAEEKAETAGEKDGQKKPEAVEIAAPHIFTPDDE